MNVLATKKQLLPDKFPPTSLMQLLSGGVMLYLWFFHCQDTIILLRWKVNKNLPSAEGLIVQAGLEQDCLPDWNTVVKWMEWMHD